MDFVLLFWVLLKKLPFILLKKSKWNLKTDFITEQLTKEKTYNFECKLQLITTWRASLRAAFLNLHMILRVFSQC